MLCGDGFYSLSKIESNKSKCCPALPGAWVPAYTPGNIRETGEKKNAPWQEDDLALPSNSRTVSSSSRISVCNCRQLSIALVGSADT